MAMSKKHYEAIAALFKKHSNNEWAVTEKSEGYDAALSDIAEDLSDYFKQENPNFDRTRFLRACGIYA